MFTCFICKTSHRTSSLICRHLKLLHGLYPGKRLRLRCAEFGCSSMFGTYSGFKKHLIRVHGDGTVHNVSVNEGESSGNCERTFELNVSEADPTSQHYSAGLNSEKLLQDMCGSVVAQLQASRIANSTFQSVVVSMEELINDIQSHTRETILRSFSSVQSSEEISQKVEAAFDDMDNPFTIFNTEAKRQKYHREKWEIVEPIECVLGVRYDVRRDKTTGVYTQVPVMDKFVYVPFLKMLLSMFKNKEVVKVFISTRIFMKTFVMQNT